MPIILRVLKQTLMNVQLVTPVAMALALMWLEDLNALVMKDLSLVQWWLVKVTLSDHYTSCWLYVVNLTMVSCYVTQADYEIKAIWIYSMPLVPLMRKGVLGERCREKELQEDDIYRSSLSKCVFKVCAQSLYKLLIYWSITHTFWLFDFLI